MSMYYVDPPNVFEYFRFEIENKELAAFFKKIGITCFKFEFEESNEEDLCDDEYADEFDDEYVDERLDECYEGEYVVSVDIDLEAGVFKISGRESGYTEHLRHVIESYLNDDMPFVTPRLMDLLIYPMEQTGKSAEFVSKWNNAQDVHKLGALDDRWFRRKEIQEFFQAMDASISKGSVEYDLGCDLADGNVCYFAEIINGRKFTARYFPKDGTKAESGAGMTFAVTGELKHFESRDKIAGAVKRMGGKVTDEVTETTDCLICNDLSCVSAEIIKAADHGARILSEAAFIRIFSVDEYSDRISPRDNLFCDIWDAPWEYDAEKLISDEGLAAVETETWQDGKWIRKRS